MSESLGYSGNDLSNSALDNLFFMPLSSQYRELYIRNGSFPTERIFIIKNTWILSNHLEKIIHINNAANIHFNNITYGFFADQDIQKQIRTFLYQEGYISEGVVGSCKVDYDLILQKGFSIYIIPMQWADYTYHNTGSGNRSSSAQNTYTDQEITNMSGIHRVAHMMYLALYKIAPAIANSFTVDDLFIAAGFMAAYALAQTTAAGWAVDLAISGMAFAYAGWAGIKALSMLIKAVYAAYNATSNQQIEDAATLAAQSSVHLALDLVVAYFVHRQIRAVQENVAIPKTEPKGTASNDDYVKTDLGQNVSNNLKLGETKIINGVKTTRVGRWMSENELLKIQNSNRVIEGAGGQTYVSTNGLNDFKGAALNNSIYVEFDAPTNSLIPGGKSGWFKMLGESASKSQKYMLQKQGGEILPKITNIKILGGK